MIRPWRAFIMPRSTPFASRKAGFRLVAMIASHSSSFMRSSRLSRVMPALLTRMAIGAEARLDVSERRDHRRAVGDVELDSGARVAGFLEIRGDRGRALVRRRGADHRRARARRAPVRSRGRCRASRRSPAPPGRRASPFVMISSRGLSVSRASARLVASRSAPSVSANDLRSRTIRLLSPASTLPGPHSTTCVTPRAANA